jgi:hypothetical protein
MTHEKRLPIPDCRFPIEAALASVPNNPNRKPFFEAVIHAPVARPGRMKIM